MDNLALRTKMKIKLDKVSVVWLNGSCSNRKAKIPVLAQARCLGESRGKLALYGYDTTPNDLKKARREVI